MVLKHQLPFNIDSHGKVNIPALLYITTDLFKHFANKDSLLAIDHRFYKNDNKCSDIKSMNLYSFKENNQENNLIFVWNGLSAD